MNKVKIAILGSGNIGTDLLVKILRSPLLECSLFVGRNLASPGMMKANSLGVRISDKSIAAIVNEPGCCEIVFDCTSALDAGRHWTILKKMGKTVIDLTPAKLGELCVPAVNLNDCLGKQNINMITCGGQATIPIASQISKVHPDVEYIEIVSSIASRSAGPATRLNIDEYVETTERALAAFTGCRKTKAILILNPAEPCIDMQTTIFAKIKKPDVPKLRKAVTQMTERVRQYVPGYRLLLPPTQDNGRLVTMIKVQGLGDYLPKFAGNLDIINCAEIAAAEEFAKKYSSR
jgi:acetaldehyde dehydrogenase